MAIAALGGNDLQTILKVVSKGMVYDNLATVSPMWEYFYGKKKDKPEGRELRYNVRSALGYPAVGALAMDGAVFHAGVKATLNEATAIHKKFGATIEVENSIVELALRDFSAYGQPIAEEVEAKGIALARDLSRQMYSDGTGIVGQFDGSDADTSISGGNFTITLSEVASERGYVGWVQKGDRLVCFANDGTDANAVNGGTAIVFLRVESVNRTGTSIVVSAFSDATTQVTVSTLSGADVGSAAQEHFLYRLAAAGTAANPAGITQAISGISSTTEYSTLSREMVGLRALASASSVTVHGLLHGSGGVVNGTAYTASGSLDSQDFQEALSQAELAVGAGRYSYKEAMMAPEQYDVLLESRETDRRFNSDSDTDRGAGAMGFNYRGARVKFKTDEFCPTYEIWIPPEGDVLQYHGTDFEPVKPQGMSPWHTAVDQPTGRYKDVVQQFMTGLGVGICIHPAAVIRISGFTP